MLSRAILPFVLLWLALASARGNNQYSVEDIQKLYESLQFAQVVTHGRALLQQQDNLSVADLIQIHQYMALSFYTLGRLDSARSHFLSLLTLNPEFQLDPVTVSPKIIHFFEDLKARWATRITAQPTPPHFVRYVVVPDPRLGALWRSALFPGWGQRFKGQNRRALLFGSAFLVGGLATGISWILEKQAHDDYRASTAPRAIETNYQDYNRWYKRRRTLGLVTLTVWTASVLDALLTPLPIHPQLKAGNRQVSLQLQWHIR